MPKFVNRQLEIYENNPIISLPDFKSTHMVNDTEFTKKVQKLIVDCIGIYFPDLFPDWAVAFTYDELTDDFHPVRDALKAFGYDVEKVDEDELITVIDKMQLLFEELADIDQPTRAVNKQFKKLIEKGYFDHHIAELGIADECVSLEKVKASGTYTIKVSPPKISVPSVQFYGFADLFKIWGKNHQALLLNANIVQQRSLKLRDKHGRETPMIEYYRVKGWLYEFGYSLKEVMYRFPPRSKGLDAQTSIFEVKTKKLNVKTWNIAKCLGFDNLQEVMENFSHFYNMMPDTALKYHATDLFATWDLHLKQQEFYDLILESFGFETREVADTTGSNVSRFIVKGIQQHFKSYDKESEKLVKKIIALGNIKNLEESPLNDFGCQPFLTVGGLLYSRMPLTKLITGKLSDSDLQSCYASFMSMMNVYLGEPVTLTCKHNKYKITLREAVELVENQNAPHDGWFIRVSGELTKSVNTLILSDLKFKSQNIKQQQLYEVSSNRKSIESFNAYKTSKRQAQSTILSKQVKFGLITKSTLEALKKLPPEWYNEYLNLKCDVISFFPGDLIADTLEEYNTIVDSLPEQDRVERFDIKNGVKRIDSQRYKNNATLRFPIKHYWQVLKQKRGEFKKANNPVQEVFKLFLNSGFGATACLFLPVNNLMAANQITSAARSGAWLMTNALNGFGCITDGTTFSWLHIPLGKTFHEILSENPSYMLYFDESLKSELVIDKNFKLQKWVDTIGKQHLMNFYKVDADDYNLKVFDYELKKENFLTEKGKVFFENDAAKVEELKYEYGVNWEDYLLENGYLTSTRLFTKFYNNNSGNYCKAMSGGHVLLEGQEFDLTDNEPFVKARSFQGNNRKLIDWYVKSIGEAYTEPLIYSETKLIKFGDGCRLAISLLESGSEEIAHPCGFDTVAYKMMKLITRSQFIFQNESQLRNFETNEQTLSELTKPLALNQKPFWNELKPEDIAVYGIEKREGVDYFPYAKGHPMGLGFELFALAPTAKGDINVVRRKLVELIEKGCKNFAPALHLQRCFSYAEPLKNLFAAIIIAKKNAEDDLRTLLENSASEPTIFTVKRENIKRLEELLHGCVDDD